MAVAESEDLLLILCGL